ncbi:hypothetical protein [Nitrospira moscoviensis]|uniref:Uncharacterized protein n=1 Tax=Nitrospira moscoviensis TaxID=42253 RepID=A0A0K2GDT6_NITMO|nr:hypothetical protein [Nitrospira moscoviensis]ALA59014.1 hypothetical protein NITMOv2_2601 [Nitrospira moscoviensis]
MSTLGSALPAVLFSCLRFWDRLFSRAMAIDVHRIEVIDDVMADVLRRKTPAERLAIGFGLWRSARVILRGQLEARHPDWDSERLDREVARRLSHGAV